MKTTLERDIYSSFTLHIEFPPYSIDKETIIKLWEFFIAQKDFLLANRGYRDLDINIEFDYLEISHTYKRVLRELKPLLEEIINNGKTPEREYIEDSAWRNHIRTITHRLNRRYGDIIMQRMTIEQCINTPLKRDT